MLKAYEEGLKFIGTKEIAGAKHSPEILAMFKAAGHGWVTDDETPWCAAFVADVLDRIGLKGTGKLNARSYLDWGEEVPLSEAGPGDVVVFWRGSKDGWQGHVGFFVRQYDDKIEVLGGNQGNAVSIAPYPKSRLLGVRTMRMPRSSPAKSTTLQATAGTAVAGATGAATAISQLDGAAQLVVIGAAVLAGLLLIWIARERLRKWAEGDR